MYKLNFQHAFNFKITPKNNSATDFEIYDIIRKKNVRLTPEEWVRQHVLHWLIQVLGYPKSVIAVEKQLIVNGLQRRTDLVAYASTGQPCLLVECKSPTVAITQQVFNQIIQYNMNLQVPYWFITNGLEHYCCKINIQQTSLMPQIEYLSQVPDYKSIIL